MQCSMVILNYKDSVRAEQLACQCAEYHIVEKIVIVDNCSNDGSYEKLKKISHKKIEVITSDKNGGFAYGNNVGAKYVVNKYNPEFLFFANTDTIFSEEILCECMLVLKKHPELGLVSTRMFGTDGKEQTAWYKFPTFGTLINDFFVLGRKKTFRKRKEAMKYNEPIQYVDMVRGSFQFFRAKALQEAGYFDEGTFLYYEEAIISQRLRKAGYKVALLTENQYVHDHVEGTNNVFETTKLMYESELYYAKKYMRIKGFGLILMRFLAVFSLIEIHILQLVKRK